MNIGHVSSTSAGCRMTMRSDPFGSSATADERSAAEVIGIDLSSTQP
jgi:hypothetical protein